MHWRWAGLVVSSFAFAAFLAYPSIAQQFPFWYLGYPGRFVDTMFHELGHAITAWTLGYPAIPSVLTIFGSEKAAGVSLTFEHRWPVQFLVWGLMAYGCWWLRRDNQQLMSWIAVGATILLMALGFWPHNKALIAYMGHGGSILVGGVFLYRGLLYLESRNKYEQWLHLFFGWSMLLGNFFFAWRLVFDPFVRNEYASFNLAGNSADFNAMQEIWPPLDMQHIAVGTLFYIVFVVVAVGWLAYIRRYDYDEYY